MTPNTDPVLFVLLFVGGMFGLFAFLAWLADWAGERIEKHYQPRHDNIVTPEMITKVCRHHANNR